MKKRARRRKRHSWTLLSSDGTAGNCQACGVASYHYESPTAGTSYVWRDGMVRDFAPPCEPVVYTQEEVGRG